MTLKELLEALIVAATAQYLRDEMAADLRRRYKAKLPRHDWILR